MRDISDEDFNHIFNAKAADIANRISQLSDEHADTWEKVQSNIPEKYEFDENDDCYSLLATLGLYFLNERGAQDNKYCQNTHSAARNECNLPESL